MDEKQLLDAIGKMMDEKILGLATREDLAGLATREELAGLATREELAGLATREDLAGLATREELAGLATREDLAGLATREEMIKLNDETRVLIENSFQKIQNLLQEEYGRVASAVAKTADYDEVKSTVAEHRSALENHNQRLMELEKKAI